MYMQTERCISFSQWKKSFYTSMRKPVSLDLRNKIKSKHHSDEIFLNGLPVETCELRSRTPCRSVNEMTMLIFILWIDYFGRIEDLLQYIPASLNRLHNKPMAAFKQSSSAAWSLFFIYMQYNCMISVSKFI